MQTSNKALAMVIFFLTLISFASGFFVSQSTKRQIVEHDTSVTIIHSYDSTIHYFSNNHIKTSKTDSIVYRAPQLDSIAINGIIERWFTHYQKTEVYRDSNLEATISDSIGENKIISRLFSYKILRPDSIIYITTKPTQNKGNLYPGLSTCFGMARPTIGPAIFYSYNRIGMYAGAGLGQNPNVNIGIHFKLKGK